MTALLSKAILSLVKGVSLGLASVSLFALTCWLGHKATLAYTMPAVEYVFDALHASTADKAAELLIETQVVQVQPQENVKAQQVLLVCTATTASSKQEPKKEEEPKAKNVSLDRGYSMAATQELEAEMLKIQDLK